MSKALTYYEYSSNIRQRSLCPYHPNLGDIREDIEIVKKHQISTKKSFSK